MAKRLQTSSIIGTWKAFYSNYANPFGEAFIPGTESIDGIERVVFNENGTYTHGSCWAAQPRQLGN